MNKSLSLAGVGPQKTASTWLYNILSLSDEYCFPRAVKETFFWDKRFENGQKWYYSHFKCRPATLYAEIGPSYFHSLNAIERLKGHNPDLKVIVTLREPVARTYSHFMHHRMRGRVQTNFWQAVNAYPEIIEASHYSKYLPIWLQAFGVENVLILMQDNISSNPLGVISHLNNFLGIALESKHMDILRPVNTGTLPRMSSLAKAATMSADWMRKHRLYSIINMAKTIGMKKLIYSGRDRNDLDVFTDQDKKSLKKILADDIKYFENLRAKSS